MPPSLLYRRLPSRQTVRPFQGLAGLSRDAGRDTAGLEACATSKGETSPGQEAWVKSKAAGNSPAALRITPVCGKLLALETGTQRTQTNERHTEQSERRPSVGEGIFVPITRIV